MKYASLNASLLARKGEARPSTTVLRPVSREAIRPQQRPEQEVQQEPRLKSPATHSDTRVAKTVRLSQLQDTQLRLLAARHKLSVQDILEQAIVKHLKREMDRQDCICKAG